MRWHGIRPGPDLRLVPGIILLAGLASAASAHPAGDRGPLQPDGGQVATLEEAEALEARLRACADRAVPTTVAVVMLGPRGQRTSTGSGTVISEDGWVATAGHVGDRAGARCTVILHDGTELDGVTAGMVFEGRRDWGLVKVDTKGRTLPAAPLRDPSSLEPGAWVCAVGHTYGPEETDWMPPAVRMGRLLVQDNLTMLVDAPFASGDSGGGVFTADGELIGIVSSAGELSWQSTATSLAPVLADIDDLKAQLPEDALPAKVPVDETAPGDGDAGDGPDAEGEGGGAAAPMPESGDGGAPDPGEGQGAPQPDQDGGPERQRRRGPRGPRFERTEEQVNLVTRESPTLLRAVAPAVDAVGTSIGVVYVHDRPVALGTIVDGEGHVVTKRSELPPDGLGIAVTMPDGEMVAASIRAERRAEDLAFLATGVEGHAFVDFEASALAGAALPLDEGMIVLSPGADGAPMALGAIGVTQRKTSRRDVTSAFIGVGVRPLRDSESARVAPEKGVAISAVTPGSPADAAGVERGDILLQADGVPIDAQATLGEVVRAHAVGERITLLVDRGGERRTIIVRGATRPRESGPPASTEDAESSRRSSGLGSVVQHDSVLDAREMGGPLVGLDGRVLGLNIARVDRTRTYALDAGRVGRAIAQMRVDEAAGVDPAVAPGGIPPATISPDGETVLSSVNADADGRGLRFAVPVRSDAGSTAGFETPQDRLTWHVSSERGGRYQVELLYSMAGDRTGPPERLGITWTHVVREPGAESTSSSTIEVTLKKTIRGRFIRAYVGDFAVPPGASTVELRALDAPATLAVRSLILKPVPASPDAAVAIEGGAAPSEASE